MQPNKKLKNIIISLSDWITKHRKIVFIVILLLGLIIRIGVMGLFLITVDKDWNDMNEKIWIALNNYLLKGINPYGQVYSMQVMDLTGNRSNLENFFQYPPLPLLVYTPVLLWPGVHSIGVIDFMPGFFIINLILGAYLFYRLFKAGFHWSAIGLWFLAAPLFAMFDSSTFIILPMLLLVLAYLNMDKTKKSALFIGLGFASYTYLIIPLLFLLIYHFRKNKWIGLKNFFIGLIPAIIIISIFFIWNPLVFLRDTLFSQSVRNPANFIFPYYSVPGGEQYWWMHLYSITPYINTLYNLIVSPNHKIDFPYLTTAFTILSFLIFIFYMIKFYKKPYRGRLVYWSFLVMLIFTLVSAAGFPHYLLLPLIITIFAFDLRKERLLERQQVGYQPPIIRYRKNDIDKN